MSTDCSVPEQLNVYEIDDAMLANLEALGVLPKIADDLAEPGEPDPAPWTGWYPGKPKPKKAIPTRSCTGCGITTTLPDLCQDCADSGWFA